MFSSQPSASGTHGGSLDQEGWIQLRIPPDGHSHGGGHRIHLEQGKTEFEQQHFGEMSLAWQAETSPGIAGGQLWSSGRWRLSLSAKNLQTPKPSNPKQSCCCPSAWSCAPRESQISGCCLLTNPVRSCRLCQCCSQNQTLKL